VRATTRFQSNETPGPLSKVAEHFPSRQLLADDPFAVGIPAVDLKAALREIEPDTFDLHSVTPLRGV
jgi:hypothetical protein